MSDEKNRVNIEDLPVPLKDLDKEEEDNVTGGGDAFNATNPTTSVNPTPTSNPINPLNPDLKNPTFNK